jgi:uncharacterized protein (DUF1697 family)
MPRRLFAFLRGINVGGKTVTKDRLLPVFESLGLARVESFLASGNVAFDAPPRSTPKSLEKKIQAAPAEQIGLATVIFVRTPEELVAIAECSPFDEAELSLAAKDGSEPDGPGKGGAINVSLFAEPPAAENQAKIEALSSADDLLRFAGRELYWVSRTKMSESPLFAVSFEKLAGLPATMRNVNTIRRLVAKYVESEA